METSQTFALVGEEAKNLAQSFTLMCNRIADLAEAVTKVVKNRSDYNLPVIWEGVEVTKLMVDTSMQRVITEKEELSVRLKKAQMENQRLKEQRSQQAHPRQHHPHPRPQQGYSGELQNGTQPVRTAEQRHKPRHERKPREPFNPPHPAPTQPKESKDEKSEVQAGTA